MGRATVCGKEWVNGDGDSLTSGAPGGGDALDLVIGVPYFDDGAVIDASAAGVLSGRGLVFRDGFQQQ